MIAAISEAGVYDLPDPVYHADPVKGGSLTSTGARKLLPPSCPAIFKWDRDNRPAPKPQFDIGHAAHLYVLGSGPQIVEVEARDWRTKHAQETRKEAHAAGLVPLLAHEHEQVRWMAEALRQHPLAAALFDPDCGRPEQTIVWQDAASGVWRRCKVDWLPDPTGARMLIPDYKTTVCAEPGAVSRSISNYGYHQQAAWYLDAAQAVGLADADAGFVFVMQEKRPPYLVTIVELTAEALAVGRGLNDRACAVYAECAASGVWPGYSDGIETVGLPAWAGDVDEGWAA